MYKMEKILLKTHFKMLSYAVIFGLVATTIALPHPEARIIGGKNVDIKDVPYQVSLQYNGQHICGGVIVSENHILTAAHCTYGFTTGLSVRVGSNFRNKGGVEINVLKIFAHPKYSHLGTAYDISVLELEEPIQPSELARPIELAKEEAQAGDENLISGWGAIQEDNLDGSEKLKSANVKAISRDNCKKAYGNQVTEDMVCTLDERGWKDACFGDDGGPLVTVGSSEPKLLGIISWAYGCGKPEYPRVYANIVELSEFIKSVISS